jgi:AraC-like DNA-binding protein
MMTYKPTAESMYHINDRHPIHGHWVDTVTQAIESMADHLEEPHSLCDVSRSVFWSPYHFHRIFHAVTSVTPARFLTALRIARAKRLLLETTASCTEISIVVGYSSFGTFTSQFTRLVGLSPGRFRRYASQVADQPAGELLADLEQALGPPVGGIEADIGTRPDGQKSQVAVGVFRTTGAAPQERPVGCAIGWSPGTVRLSTPAAPSQIMAMSAHPDATVGDLLSERPEADLCIGRAAACGSGLSITLRPRCVIDPPVLFAFVLARAM